MRQAGKGTKSCLRPSLPLSRRCSSSRRARSLSALLARMLAGWPLPLNCSLTRCPVKSPGPCLPSLSAVCPSIFPPRTSFAVYFPTLVAHNRKNLCEIPRMVWPRHNSFKCPEVPVVWMCRPPSSDLLGMDRNLPVGEGQASAGTLQCWHSSPWACTSVLHLRCCTAGQFWLTGSSS